MVSIRQSWLVFDDRAQSSKHLLNHGPFRPQNCQLLCGDKIAERPISQSNPQSRHRDKSHSMFCHWVLQRPMNATPSRLVVDRNCVFDTFRRYIERLVCRFQDLWHNQMRDYQTLLFNDCAIDETRCTIRQRNKMY